MNKMPCYRREGDPSLAWSLDPHLVTDPSLGRSTDQDQCLGWSPCGIQVCVEV